METYTTVSGDTFDKIAFDKLGSEYLFPLLLKENYKYRDVLIFESGIILNIPEVELDEYEGIPEWMSDFEDESGGYVEEEEYAEIALSGIDS